MEEQKSLIKIKRVEKEFILQKNIRFFLIGIIIYTISTFFFTQFIESGKFINLIQTVALLLCFFYGIKLFSLKNSKNLYLNILITVFFCWEIFIVLHGLILDYAYIKEYLFTGLRGIQYVVPVIVFLPVISSFFLNKLFDYIYKLSIVFLFLIPFLFTSIITNQTFSEAFLYVFALPSGIILLTAPYQSKKRVIIALIVVILSLIFMTIIARRARMFTLGCFLFFSFFIYFILNKNISLTKKIILLVSVIALTTISYNIFVSNQNTYFSKITKRAGEDTRSDVLLFYFLDMTDQDLLIGKGINGTYYAPGIDRSWSGGEDPRHRDLDYRVYIETGYLQLMLNGGIIYLTLYLLILLPAIIIGFFFSRNVFSKACAILVLMHLIDMVPFGLPAFDLNYFFVWISVAICYSKKIRNKDEEEIKQYLCLQNEVNVES